jgi:hypothetical protein
MVTDAFKPGQTPGASDSMIAGADIIHSVTAAAQSDATAAGGSDTTASAGPRPVSGGIDSAMGGLY